MVINPTAVVVPRELYRGGAPRELFVEAARFFRQRVGTAVGDWPEALTERWLFGPSSEIDDYWSLAVNDDGPVGFCLARELGDGAEALLCYLSGRYNTSDNAAGLLETAGRGRAFVLVGETALSPPVSELAKRLPRSGWERFPRLELLYDFNIRQPPRRRPAHPEYDVVRLVDDELVDLALLQASCYLGTVDARLHPRLAEPSGSRRVVEEVIEGRYGEPLRSACLLARGKTGGAVAFILTTRTTDVRGRQLGFVASVGVGPAHRGRGLGRLLVGEALRTCRSAGLAGVFLMVNADNHTGRALYRNVGFEQNEQTALYRRRPGRGP